MSVVSFRTADGRVIKFTSKPKRKKNPSNTKGYRAKSRVASRVDALDALRRKAKKKAAPKRKVRKAAVKRKRVTSKTGCRTVKFKACRGAGTGKARKASKGKTLYKKNGLAAHSFVKGKALKGTAALKGKKNGQVFKSAGKAYRMISYKHPSSGKMVRYALRVKASAK